MLYLARIVALASSRLALVGCSDQSPRYPVAGRVLVDGRPLARGTIKFVPESGRPVSGKIKPDGSFMLSESSLSSSRLTDGVVPGIYRVSVSAAKVIDEDADQVEWLAPSQYADFRTSGIELEIDRPCKDLIVDLTWKGSESVDDGADESRTAEAMPGSTTVEQEASPK